MRDRNSIVAVLALVVLIGALPVAVASMGAPANTAISLGESVTDSPSGSVSAEPGETVTLTVWANGSSISGYQTELSFDPSVVAVESVSGAGDFDDPVSNVNNDDGWVAFNQIHSSETSDPVLATLTVTVRGDDGDATDIAFAESETAFSDGDGETSSPEAFNTVSLTVENASEEPTETPEPNETATPTPTETPTEAPTEDDDDDDDNDGGGGGGGGDDDDDDNDGGGGGGGGGIPPQEPSFNVTTAQLNASTALPNGSVLVSATIENSGDDDGDFEARLYVNENETQNQTIEIDEDEERDVNFTHRFDEPGNYSFRVNQTTAGNVTVEAPNSTATETPTENATAEPTATQEPTATATATESATQTDATESEDTGATDTATDSVDTSEPTTTDMPTTTDGFGPGFGAATVFVTMSILVGWLGLRREGAH